MTALTRRLGAVAVTMVAALLLATNPAHAATVLSTGHVDVFDIDYAGGVLTLDIRDGTVSPVNDDLPAADAELVVLPGALSTVPSGSSFACLGTANDPVYLLPQQENLNLLWPGWNTSDVPSGQLQNNKVGLELDLANSTIPTGAKFALYTTSLGSASFKFNTNTATATGCQIMTWPGGGISRGTHGHGFWAFSTAGTYELTFRATATTTGGVVKSSGDRTYKFTVG